jgi:hypothetical protein
VSHTKQSALITTLMLVAGVVLLGAGSSSHGTGAVLLGGAGLLMVAVAFFAATRVKCGSCGQRVAAMFPAGSVFVLWAAKQPCRNCGNPL